MEFIERITIIAIIIPKREIEIGPGEVINVATNGGRVNVTIFITKLFAPNTFPLFFGTIISHISAVDAIAIAPAPRPIIKLARLITI